VPLVEPPRELHGNPVLVAGVQRRPERAHGALQHRRMRFVEFVTVQLEQFARSCRLVIEGVKGKEIGVKIKLSLAQS